MTTEASRKHALLEDITFAPLSGVGHLSPIDRVALRDHLWDKGWRIDDLAAHELANGGCVPSVAYRDLREAHANLLSKVLALVDEHERSTKPAPYTSGRALIERLRSILTDEAGR